MADAYLTFTLPPQFSLGDTVSAVVGGIYMGDFAVDNTNSIYVTFGSDATGTMTATYLSGLSPVTGENATQVYFDDGSGKAWYTVPVVIGKRYYSDAAGIRPVAQEDIKGKEGGAIADTKRVHTAGLLVSNVAGSIQVAGGTSFNTMTTVNMVQSDLETAITVTSLYSGPVWTDAVEDEYGFDGIFSWRFANPLPGTVSAYNAFFETAER